ncbi:MAG: DUF2961 domain-containing protein [Kiritimatiellaceae bacterium]|nr:DUF2961 domain-containing protein [Kiritimatiellaceae bacterium]
MRLFLSGLIFLAVCGCSQPRKVSYADLLSSLTNLNQMASLAVPQTHLISSYDRTGANEDNNYFQGKTKDGQFILADLKGPGVVSRLWFTGDPHNANIHFYFDDEPTPRMSFKWDVLGRGILPINAPPLAMAEQICWRSFLPIPYSKRLRITVEDAGYAYGKAPKFYYQLNWNSLPQGQTVESFSLPVLDQNRALIDTICADWEKMSFPAIPPLERDGVLPPGGTLKLFSAERQGTISGISISPGFSNVPSPAARSALLRDIVLKIYWDGQTEPSVSVPLGDFFGSMWQRWAGQSMFFGMDQDAFFCRWPMPFRKGARIELENQGTAPVSIRWGVSSNEAQVPLDSGYFHAAFNRSGANAVGAPHTVLETSGDGKYVGCMLGVWSVDNSFWVLESDETMYIDGGKKPYWQGTGLEDYFNSGWYYRKVFERPLHGLPVKSPFRTVQYRLHLDDAVLFNKSFNMIFERGPDQASKAAYDSVAFYYLKNPQPAAGQVGNATWRARPRSRLEQLTLMTDIWNLERFNDLPGEIDFIDRYIEQYNPPFTPVLKLRQLMCRYKDSNISRAELLQNLDGFLTSADAKVRSFAETLKKFYSEPSVFLLGAYCNMTAEVYLDGQRMLTAGNPEQPVVVPVKLEKGMHVIAVRALWQQYPYWMQAWIESPAGLLTDGRDWKHAVNPSGEWAALNYDDSKWNPAGCVLEGVKSPPEVPYVWAAPDPYVNASSKVLPVCPGDPWDGRGFVVYRKFFEVK